MSALDDLIAGKSATASPAASSTTPKTKTVKSNMSALDALIANGATTSTPTKKQAVLPFIGKGYGPANATDTFSSQPLATVPMDIPKTFMSPETTAEVVDPNRVDPSFDPTLKQPEPQATKNGHPIDLNARMPKSASDKVRADRGLTKNQQLDHIESLELGGSNEDTNLRAEDNAPGKKTGEAGSQPSAALEDELAKNVDVEGSKSLLDAQREIATSKGKTLPEDAAKNSGLDDYLLNHPNTLEPLAGAQDAITGTAAKVGGFLKGLFTKPGKTLSDVFSNKNADKVFNAIGGNAVVHPVQAMKSIVAQASNSADSTWSNLAHSAAQVVENGREAQKDPTKMNSAKNVADILSLLGAAASTAFYPVSETFDIASQLPVIKPAADAVGLIFKGTGQVGGFAASALLDLLPLSDDWKSKLQVPIHNIGMLVGQIALGGKIYADIAGGMDPAKAEASATSNAKDINTADAWNKLGRPATIEEAELKYRQLAHSAHPDLPGGSNEKMSDLNQAIQMIRENGIPSSKVQAMAPDKMGPAPTKIAGELPSGDEAPIANEPKEALSTEEKPIVNQAEEPAQSNEIKPVDTEEKTPAETDRAGNSITRGDRNRVIKIEGPDGKVIYDASKQPAKTPASQKSNLSPSGLTPNSQAYMDNFNRGEGQQIVASKGGKDFSVGDFGKAHFRTKTAEGKSDRLSTEDLKPTIDNIKEVYRGSNDPTTHRANTAAWVAHMPDGEKRVVYTKENRFGHEEITSAHKVDEKVNPNYLSTLRSRGIPTGNRTQISLLEGGRSSTPEGIPLSYRDESTIPKSEGTGKETPSEAQKLYKDQLRKGSIDFGNITGKGVVENVKETAASIKKAITESHEKAVVAQGVDEGLRTLEDQNIADTMRFGKIYANSGINADEERHIYDAREEGKTGSLTPKEKEVNDHVITPIKDEQARIISKLKDRGLPVNDTHNSRIVMDRGTFFDKLKAGVEGAKTKGGGLLTKSAPSLKRRTMLGLENEDGKRLVVSAKGGVVTAFENGKPTNLGRYDSVANLADGKEFVDKNGNKWKFTQATTKEIEQNTKLKYSHFSLANELITLQKLTSAERASDWLEQFKEHDPDFEKIAFKLGSGNPPEGYKVTNAPQFRGYVFDPQVANAIDRFYKANANDEGLLNTLKLSLYIRNVSLFNPIYHPFVNVLPSFFHAKGVLGTFNPKDMPANIGAGYNAMKAVVDPLTAPAEGLPSYVDLLDHGATLTSSHLQSTLGDAIKKKLGVDLNQNPTPFKQMADALGWANPVKWLDFLIGKKGISARISFSSEDVARLQIIYKSIGEGMSVDDAVKQVDDIFPTNRISEGQYNLVQKAIGQAPANFFADPHVTMFSGYHASLFKTLYNDVKDAVTGSGAKESKGGNRAAAADRIAGLLIGILFLYPAYDAILKAATKNPGASAKRGGVFAPIDTAVKAAEGKESFGAAVSSVFTLNPMFEAFFETVGNSDWFTNTQPLPQGTSINPKTVAGAFLKELGGGVQGVTAPSAVASGNKPLASYLWSLAGVTVPKSTPSIVNLNAMIYDERPQLLTQVKTLVDAGDTAGATKIITDFNQRLLKNAMDALIENGYGKPKGLGAQVVSQIAHEAGYTGDVSQLRSQVIADPNMKKYWLALPSDKVMSNFQANKTKTSGQKLFGVASSTVAP